MTALKIFLSIRPAKSMGDNQFKIKSKKRNIDEHALYYKYIQNESGKKEIVGLRRMLPSDANVFLYHLKQHLKNLDNKKILFFIHGYHPFQKKLHLKLLHKLYENYASNANLQLGAIIFFSWPNRGAMWKEDDEAAEIGKILATEYHSFFSELRKLSDELDTNLNLMCQSFGHHVLNSFLHHYCGDKTIFDKAFLMAADIPNQSLREQPPGISIKNKYGNGPTYTNYNLTNMRSISKITHIFNDPYDVILTASKKSFLKDYERLGKTGPVNNLNNNFIINNYKGYENNMVLGKKISVKIPRVKIFFASLKTNNKYNLRHQYFYSNPTVVKMVSKEL